MVQSATRRPANLEKRLAAYAASAVAGASLLATTSTAEAKVVYTPAHLEITEGSSFYLDLNHDGTPDFVLSNFFSGFGYVQLFGAIPQAENAVVNDGFCYTSAFFPLAEPAALPAGAEIGKTRKFQPSGACMRGKFASVIEGHWQNVNSKYLGLGFRINGKVHYGWARLNTAGTHPFKAILTGYAYETEPGKAIRAGDEGSQPFASESPEAALPLRLTPATVPLTLGVLALGAHRP